MIHVSVLLDEVLTWLDPQPGQTIVDGTLGAGGHTRAIAERVGPAGRVIALDRDPAAIKAAEQSLSGLPVTLVHANFCDLPEVLEQLAVPPVDGVLFDLGLSSDQLADAERGFSFDAAGPLDLRFDTSQGEPAWRLIERLPPDELADLIYEFGEERLSRQIARELSAERERSSELRSAHEVAEVVRRTVRRITRQPRREERIDPATRTFQALRIAVNQELRSLDLALERMRTCVRLGGRLAIISFHSLEDRPVKQAFKESGYWKALTRRPIEAGTEELERNPRAHSAKLRVAVREDQKSETINAPKRY